MCVSQESDAVSEGEEANIVFKMIRNDHKHILATRRVRRVSTRTLLQRHGVQFGVTERSLGLIIGGLWWCGGK